jgi:hypothetical protein
VSAVAALAATLALGLAACGSDDDSTGPSATGSTELEITLDPDGAGGEPAREQQLSCPGDDAPACEAVAGLPSDPTAPVPPQTACTEIYGGPDTLAIEGTLRGEQVDAQFTRANGCEIERFDRFVGVLTELFPDYEPGAALSP